MMRFLRRAHFGVIGMEQWNNRILKQKLLESDLRKGTWAKAVDCDNVITVSLAICCVGTCGGMRSLS